MVDIATLSYAVNTGPLEKGEAALDKMSAAHTRAGTTADKMTGQVAATGRAVNATRAHSLNMSYQLNDIAVGFASGQSPFTILMQQGMQMQQIFAQTGQTSIRGGLGMIGQTFKSMINPITLAIIGVSVLAGGLSKLFSIMTNEGDKAEEVLKRHESIISDLKEAYGDAAKGAEEYIAKSKDVIRLAIEAEGIRSAERIRKETEKLVADIEEIYDRLERRISRAPSMARLGHAVRVAPTGEESNFLIIKQAVEALQQSMKDGEPDILRFREIISSIGVKGDSALKTFIGDVIKTTEETAKAARAAAALGNALDGIAIAGHEAFQKGMEKLDVFVDKGLSRFDRERNRIKATAFEVSNLARVSGEAYSVIAKFNAAMAVVDRNEAEAAARKAKRTTKTSAFESEIKSIREKTQALEIEAATFGMAESAAKRYEITQVLIAKARESNIAITPALVDAIKAEANAYVEAMDKIKKLNDEKERAKEITAGLSGLLFNAVRGADSFAAAMKRLADAISDAALEAALMGTGPLAALFGLKTSDGSQGGLIGTLVGALVGGATGVPVATGQPSDFGLSSSLKFAQGGSFIVGGSGGPDSQNVSFKASPGERVDVSTPGSAPGGGVTVVQHNDFRGVDPSMRAFLAAQLAASQAQTVKIVTAKIQQERVLNPATRRG